MNLQNQYAFTLPKGYMDHEGVLHKKGVMRLATAKDEIEAMSHPRAKAVTEYVSLILLSEVILSLGELQNITLEIVESFYTADVNFLQNLYQTINHDEDAYIHVKCPHCGQEFDEPLNFTQEE